MKRPTLTHPLFSMFSILFPFTRVLVMMKGALTLLVLNSHLFSSEWKVRHFMSEESQRNYDRVVLLFHAHLNPKILADDTQRHQFVTTYNEFGLSPRLLTLLSLSHPSD